VALWTIIATTLAFTIACGSPIWAHAATQNVTPKKATSEVLRDVSKRVAAIIERDQLPQTYTAVESVFNRVLHGFNAMRDADEPPILSEIRIIDDEKPNAFVAHFIESSTGEKKNLVFVSKALLHDFFSEGVESGARLLAGVLAHEMAHPLDKLDFNGLYQRWGKFRSSQAQEIRAELEGIEILVKAGLPPDSLYRALQRIEGNEARSNGNLVTATLKALSTHPDQLVRESAQRLYLTFRSYEYGDPPTRPIEGLPKEVHSELQIIQDSDPFKIEPHRKRTLDELLHELEHLPPRGQGAMLINRENVYFNFLITRLDEELQHLDNQVSQKQLERMGRLYATWIAPDQEIPALFQKHNDPDPHQKKWIGGKLHRDVMDQIPAYSRKEFRTALQTSLMSKFAQKQNGFDSAISAATDRKAEYMAQRSRYHEQVLSDLNHFLPADVVMEDFRPILKTIVRQTFNVNSEASSIASGYFFRIEKLSPPMKLKLSRVLLEDVVPELPTEASLTSITHLHPFYFQNHWNQSRTNAVRNSENALSFLDEPKNARYKKDVSALARHYWNHRGEYAVLEILDNWSETYINWELIFRENGIDRRTGIAELKRSIKEFTLSEKFALLAKSMQAKNYTFQVPHQSGQLLYADESLVPYLSGKHNPKLQDPKIREYLKNNFAGKLYAKDIYLSRSAFRKRLRERLAKDLPTQEAIRSEYLDWIYKETLKDVFGISEIPSKYSSTPSKLSFLHPHHDIIAEEINRSKLSSTAKQIILKSAFARSQNDYFPYSSEGAIGWTVRTESYPAQSRTLQVLKESGAFSGPTEVLRTTIAYDREIKPESVFASMTNLEPPFLAELEEINRSPLSAEEKLKRLQRMVFLFAPQKDADYSKMISAKNAALKRIRKKFVETAISVPMTQAQSLEIFDWLTRSDRSKDTDLFLAHILAEHPLKPDSDAVNTLQTLLEDKRVHSPLAQLSVGQTLLEPKIAKLKPGRVKTKQLEDLLEQIATVVPSDSQQRDDFLEDLAWRLEIESEEHLEMIEAQKSINWRKQDPRLVNFASFVSENVKDMDQDGRKELIRYLMNPGNQDVPPTLVAALERKVDRDMVRENSDSTSAERQLKRDNRVYHAKSQLEAFASELTAEGKVPLFEMILHADERRIETHREYQKEIIREFLKLAPEKERGLLVALNKMPDYEVAATLAYQMSYSGSDKSGAVAMAEAFKSVGKKTAQLAATWGIYGDQVSNELNKVKDDARPMSKLAARRAMKAGLPEQEYAKIKRVRKRMGSAAMRSVFDVELYGGDEAAALVQYPNAKAQIDHHLNRSQKYLQGVESEGIEMDAPVLKQMLQASRSQLYDELKGSREIERIQMAEHFYAKMNRDLAGTLGSEWKFEVPGLKKSIQSSETVLFTKLIKPNPMVQGKTIVNFKDMPAGPEKTRVGRAIVEASLRGLFRDEFFDPDRHFGNFLIDLENKTIHPIDFGQAEPIRNRNPFSADYRYRLSMVLKSVESGDAAATLSHALPLAKGQLGRLPQSVEAPMVRDLAEAFKDVNDIEGRLTALIRVFSKHGIDVDRHFLAGALKGLMTLMREGYVDRNTFMALIRDEIKQMLVLKKLPRFVGSCVKDSVREFLKRSSWKN
jgi:hypothetical protein